jgi:folate-binding protein YgfZ
MGEDAFTFLQNIISNDLSLLLQPTDLIHACLLTAQGKYLHDFYVRRDADHFILNCEAGARGDDLLKRLTLYKLRADVSFHLEHIEPPADAIPFEQWDETRIRLGQPDGLRDAELGVSTLAELNLDQVAVSYTKGCYVGQELVARMHNRNLGKKHLVPVEFDTAPPPHGTEIENFGQMRSSCGNLALIMMPRVIEDNLKLGTLQNAPFRLLGL